MIYVNRTIMRYALSLYSDVRQLFLMKMGRKKRRRDITKVCDFHLPGTFFSSYLLVLLKPDDCGEMLYRSPHDKELREAFSQQHLRHWGLSPRTPKEQNSAYIYMSDLGSGPFPIESWGNCSPVRDPESEDPAKLHLDSRNCEITNVVVICH